MNELSFCSYLCAREWFIRERGQGYQARETGLVPEGARCERCWAPIRLRLVLASAKEAS